MWVFLLLFFPGTKYYESDPVYPAGDVESEGVFPDGNPFKKDKNPSYVFVWKTWGRRSIHLITVQKLSCYFSEM